MPFLTSNSRSAVHNKNESQTVYTGGRYLVLVRTPAGPLRCYLIPHPAFFTISTANGTLAGIINCFTESIGKANGSHLGIQYIVICSGSAHNIIDDAAGRKRMKNIPHVKADTTLVVHHLFLQTGVDSAGGYHYKLPV